MKLPNPAFMSVPRASNGGERWGGEGLVNAYPAGG